LALCQLTDLPDGARQEATAELASVEPCSLPASFQLARIALGLIFEYMVVKNVLIAYKLSVAGRQNGHRGVLGMIEEFVASDSTILDLLRKNDGMTVTELAGAMEVTPTAVRQRLNRLMAQEMIERSASRHGRGRPIHHYRLTEKGRRKAGSNFADLAVALWEEISQLEDLEVRRRMMQSLASRLAVMYADRIQGRTLEEKMQSLSELFAERRIPMDVQQSDSLPVLTATVCPYPELAEQDRSICNMERMLFSELLGADVHLAKCRLDGAECCSFQSN
jgi:predicted ArsR family transcriptional regulator